MTKGLLWIVLILSVITLGTSQSKPSGYGDSKVIFQLSTVTVQRIQDGPCTLYVAVGFNNTIAMTTGNGCKP